MSLFPPLHSMASNIRHYRSQTQKIFHRSWADNHLPLPYVYTEIFFSIILPPLILVVSYEVHQTILPAWLF